MIATGGLRQGGGLCLALGLIVIVVYSGVLSVPFQYDDLHSIVDNPHIRNTENIPAFFSQPEMFSADPRSRMYRPLVLLSYAVDYRLHQDDAGGFHWTNLFLHTASTCVVALLALSFTNSLRGAAVAGLVFGLHPANAEAVVYVSSRSESMCAVFVLIALLAYVRAQGSSSRPTRWMIASFAAYAAALLSKAVGITLPLALLLYEVIRCGDPLRECLRRLMRVQWPYWVVTLVYIVAVRQMLHQAVIEAPVRRMDVQAWTQIKALAYYLKLLVMPHPLSVEHQFNLGSASTQGAVVWALLFLVTALALVLGRAFSASERSWIFWVMWPLVTLLPTLVVPLNVLVNEHRLYLPSVAVAMGAAFLLTRWRQGNPGWSVSMAIMLIGGMFALYDGARVRVWQDSESLWSDAIAKGSRMPRPHIYLGDHLKESGRYVEALRSYETALNVNPAMLSGLDRVVAYNNMGATLLTMGRSEDAIEAYRTALRLDSTYVKAREALEGLLAFRQKGGGDATSLYKQGLQALWAGQIEFAIARLQAALEKQRSAATLMALGIAYERLGDTGAAIHAYRDLALSFSETVSAATAARKADSLGALEGDSDE